MHDVPTHTAHAQSTEFGTNGRTGRSAPLLVGTARRIDLAPATDLSTEVPTALVKTGRDSRASYESAQVSHGYVMTCTCIVACLHKNLSCVWILVCIMYLCVRSVVAGFLLWLLMFFGGWWWVYVWGGLG